MINIIRSIRFFWKCQFCGHTNPGYTETCDKCGARRPN